MSSNNSTPPNAIDLALDALREYEKFYDIACNDDRPVTRELAAKNADFERNRAAKNADFERNRAAILAQVAVALYGDRWTPEQEKKVAEGASKGASQSLANLTQKEAEALTKILVARLAATPSQEPQP